MNYSIKDIEKMIDEMPNGRAKEIAKKAMNIAEKEGKKYVPPTGRPTYDDIKEEKIFRLSDEEVKALLKKQENKDG